MNPSINDSPNMWVKFEADGRGIEYKDISYSTLARYFGGRPLDPPAPPDPDPVPDPSPPGPNPMPPLPFPPDDFWLDLYEIIISIIRRDCLRRGEQREGIKQRIRFPDRRLKWRLESSIRRRSNIRPRQWRREGHAAKMDEYYRWAREAPEQYLSQMVAEAEQDEADDKDGSELIA